MASTSTNPATYWTSLADNELNVELVQKTLGSVSDDLWVACACADRNLDDAGVQKALLELGISRTQTAMERSRNALINAPNGSDDGSGDGLDKSGTQAGHNTLVAHYRGVPDHALLCHIRAVLFGRLGRLNSWVEMCKEVPEGLGEEAEVDDEEWEDDPWADGNEGAGPSTPHEAKPAAQPPIPLSDFLTEQLLTIACRLASMEWFGALGVLYRHHDLWPYRYIILQCVPGHVHPSSYRDILPTFDASKNAESAAPLQPRRAEADWTEGLDAQQALRDCGEGLGTLSNFIASEEYEVQTEPLTADELANWYKTRVEEIVSSTGMVDIALAIIQYGASQGIPGLDELGEELSLLSRLVYDAPQGDEHNGYDWTLTRWLSMEPPTVVRAYLAHSTPESLPKDIVRLVMPYLFVLEARAERAGTPDPSLPNRLMYDFILSAPLEMAAAIFEASKPTLPAAQRLIRDDEDIARLALACLYGSDALDQWSTMSRIFECLPAWDVSKNEEGDDDVADTTVSSLGAFVAPTTSHPRCSAADLLMFFKPLPLMALSRALDILDVHLESGEILSRWSVPAPLRWLLQSHNDVNEQRRWANRMARRAGGIDDQLSSVEDWDWLLEDMLKLCSKGESGLRGAFGLLTRDEVISIFFGGLLSSGKFDVAQNLLNSPKSKVSLDADTVEEICLASSREFYDNASSGNYKFGDMKLAYDCLAVPRPSDRIVKEREFIEATSRLSSFNVTSRPGIPISPIEIRLTKDRLSLVSRVLSSNNDAYKHTEVILDLVHRLGFRDDVVAEVKTLAMLADTALQVEDFTRAYEISERMVSTVISLRSLAPLGLDDPKVSEASEVCWVACFQLGRQPEFDDLHKKLSLLGHALELCPAEKIHDVLTSWRRLEKEDIEIREERLSNRQDGSVTAPGSRKRPASAPINAAYSLRARLQDFHMPSPPLLSTPDAAALATRTFRTVTATFPFSVGSRGQSQASDMGDENSMSESQRQLSGEDMSAQATRVFSKGIGWLIGADDHDV